MGYICFLGRYRYYTDQPSSQPLSLTPFNVLSPQGTNARQESHWNMQPWSSVLTPFEHLIAICSLESNVKIQKTEPFCAESIQIFQSLKFKNSKHPGPTHFRRRTPDLHSQAGMHRLWPAQLRAFWQKSLWRENLTDNQLGRWKLGRWRGGGKSFRQESEHLNPEGPETVEGLKSRSACDLPAAVGPERKGRKKLGGRASSCGEPLLRTLCKVIGPSPLPGVQIHQNPPISSLDNPPVLELKNPPVPELKNPPIPDLEIQAILRLEISIPENSALKKPVRAHCQLSSLMLTQASSCVFPV